MKILASSLLGLGILILVVVGVLVGLIVDNGNEAQIKIGIARWVNNPEHEKNVTAFKKGLAEAGYFEGEQVEFLEVPASDGDAERHKQTAKFYSESDVDLIYSLTTSGTQIIKNEIPDHIPIVFSIVTFPVEAGLIDGLSHSENNLVGTRNWVPVSEQLAVLLEMIPTISRLGFVRRAGELNSEIQLNEMILAASLNNIEVIDIAAKNLDELQSSLKEAKNQIDSIFLACDTLIQGEQGEDVVLEFTRDEELPDLSCIETGVRKGALLGVVADFEQIGNVSGQKAARILDGVSPTTLETDTAARPFLYVNADRANQLGLLIPQSILARSKAIIQNTE